MCTNEWEDKVWNELYSHQYLFSSLPFLQCIFLYFSYYVFYSLLYLLFYCIEFTHSFLSAIRDCRVAIAQDKTPINKKMKWATSLDVEFVIGVEKDSLPIELLSPNAIEWEGEGNACRVEGVQRAGSGSEVRGQMERESMGRTKGKAKHRIQDEFYKSEK
jgi:hypothetical protein